MIIVRTPLRVSFFGGGTDHPTWFRTNPGAVLSTTIDKYVYITLRRLPPIFDFKYRVAWRMLEQTKQIADIQHPVVRTVLENYAPPLDCGYEIVYHADLPARSGLGSSSAFTVAALHAIWAHSGRPTPKLMLAREAVRVEQNLLKEPVGSQDQTAVAFGGLNQIDFGSDGSLTVDPVDIAPRRRAELQSHLIIVFTNFTRDAGVIEKKKTENFAAKQAQLRRMYEMVGEGRTILENRTVPMADFGALLGEAWQSKKQLADGVSNAPIDHAYDVAIEAGALGGKLLGAGGGGFLLFFAPPEKHADVLAALNGVELGAGTRPVHVPIQLENDGSRIVLHDPELTSNYDSMFAREVAGWATSDLDKRAQ